MVPHVLKATFRFALSVRRGRQGSAVRGVVVAVAHLIMVAMTASAADAQSVQGGATSPSAAQPQQPAGQVNRQAARRPQQNGKGRLKLTALLTDSGPIVRKGLAWRIYRPGASGSLPTLVRKLDGASPTIDLDAGSYLINVAFGLAHITRLITVRANDNRGENFTINAGGLRIRARTEAGSFSSPALVQYDLFSDERDQYGKRKKILSNVRPGRITRLNSGIYRIVSKLGDANAIVAAEVTVEAGKLTEATVVHEAAKVTFKLVERSGGEALAGAQWIIMTNAGKVIKETAGALPSHVLAPGSYTISARWRGKLHTRSFAINSGDNVEVEVEIR